MPVKKPCIWLFLTIVAFGCSEQSDEPGLVDSKPSHDDLAIQKFDSIAEHKYGITHRNEEYQIKYSDSIPDRIESISLGKSINHPSGPFVLFHPSGDIAFVTWVDNNLDSVPRWLEWYGPNENLFYAKLPFPEPLGSQSKAIFIDSYDSLGMIEHCWSARFYPWRDSIFIENKDNLAFSVDLCCDDCLSYEFEGCLTQHGDTLSKISMDLKAEELHEQTVLQVSNIQVGINYLHITINGLQKDSARHLGWHDVTIVRH